MGGVLRSGTVKRSHRPTRIRLWVGRHRILAGMAVVVVVALVAVTVVFGITSGRVSSKASGVPAGISKIQHVIVIMQENRSFDSYFGTFPGADGIPMQDGSPTVCVPDPANGSCVKPYYDPSDRNSGGPHGQSNATADIDGGKMDGFIAQAAKASTNCAPNDPACAGGKQTDVMGYHDGRDLPNYWAYAKNFTSPRPHVRTQRVLEPARAPVYGFGVVRQMQSGGRPGVVRECPSKPGQPAGLHLLD